MTRQTLLPILFMALTLTCPGGQESALAAVAVAPSQADAATVPAIEAYVRQMDAYVRRERRRGRLFGDTSDYTDQNAQARWREFRSKRAIERAEVYSAATAWTNAAGSVVVAEFSLSSPSGDWAQYNTYYFRDDGTLAKLHSELRTFMGDLIVIRDRFFDPRAKLLQEKTRYLDLQTRRPKKVEAGSFQDMPIEAYARTSDLPFYSLLKKQG